MSVIRIKTKVPGPASLALLAERRANVSDAVFTQVPIFIARANNATVTDVDGNVFLDFAGGIGANNVGHCHPEVVEAAKKQIANLIHSSFSVASYEPYVLLAEKMNQITPGTFEKRTAFFNSGAEAVENAVKFSRFSTKRQGVVVFEHAFHGRTLLTMSMTSKVKPYKFGFEPFAPEIYRMHMPYLYRRPKEMTEAAYIRQCIEEINIFFETQVAAEETACLVLEPVLGEGGFIVPPVDWMNALAERCRKEGIVFVADEVQTGFCRTGKMFATERFGVVPDMIVTAKSIAGGFPLSAVTGRKEIMELPPGEIGGTFGGNPVSCAAGLAAIHVMREERLERAAMQIEKVVARRFNSLKSRSPFVGDVRGLGAMQALEIVEDKDSKEPAKELTQEIVRKCYEKGLLLFTGGTYGNVVRTLMPLTIPIEHLEEGLDVLEDVILALK